MLIPVAPAKGLIVAIPTLKDVDWITSALKVLSPTTPLLVPYKDFTSPIYEAVIAIAILPFATPSILRDSFKIKSPSVS